MAKKTTKSSGTSSAKTNVKRVTKAASKYDTSKSIVENSDAISGMVTATATSAKRSKDAKQKKLFITLLVVIIVVALVGIIVYGYYQGWFDAFLGKGNGGNGGGGGGGDNIGGNGEVADISIHFIDLGANSGDSVYIKAGDTDILIDAGAIKNNADQIRDYIKKYCTDNTLEYVIATHADQDHIAAFVGSSTQKGILDTFTCENIIRFAKTNKSTSVVTDFLAKCETQKAQGANYYTALECYNNENGAKRIYDVANGITMEILYQDYYETKSSDENNYSVCLMFTQGNNHYLFTGDLEEAGEKSLVAKNPNLPKVELFKAGHHGSATSSNTVLLNVIQPKYVVASCGAGDDYGFPRQDFIDRVAPFTDNVYVTGIFTSGYTMNGNVVFSCINDVITLQCSNNNIKLKETEWFKQYRTMPDAWKDEQ